MEGGRERKREKEERRIQAPAAGDRAADRRTPSGVTTIPNSDSRSRLPVHGITPSRPRPSAGATNQPKPDGVWFLYFFKIFSPGHWNSAAHPPVWSWGDIKVALAAFWLHPEEIISTPASVADSLLPLFAVSTFRFSSSRLYSFVI